MIECQSYLYNADSVAKKASDGAVFIGKAARKNSLQMLI